MGTGKEECVATKYVSWKESDADGRESITLVGYEFIGLAIGGQNLTASFCFPNPTSVFQSQSLKAEISSS